MNSAWLALLLITIALHSSHRPPLKFRFEVGNNPFYQCSICLDESNHFDFRDHGCMGGSQCQGWLTAQQADDFLHQVEARFGGRPSSAAGTETFWTEHVQWQGSMTDADRRWLGTTWCHSHPAIEKARARLTQPL